MTTFNIKSNGAFEAKTDNKNIDLFLKHKGFTLNKDEKKWIWDFCIENVWDINEIHNIMIYIHNIYKEEIYLEKGSITENQMKSKLVSANR